MSQYSEFTSELIEAKVAYTNIYSQLLDLNSSLFEFINQTFPNSDELIKDYIKHLYLLGKSMVTLDMINSRIEDIETGTSPETVVSLDALYLSRNTELTNYNNIVEDLNQLRFIINTSIEVEESIIEDSKVITYLECKKSVLKADYLDKLNFAYEIINTSDESEEIINLKDMLDTFDTLDLESDIDYELEILTSKLKQISTDMIHSNLSEVSQYRESISRYLSTNSETIESLEEELRSYLPNNINEYMEDIRKYGEIKIIFEKAFYNGEISAHINLYIFSNEVVRNLTNLFGARFLFTQLLHRLDMMYNLLSDLVE